MAESSLPKAKRCPRCKDTKDASEFGTRWFAGRLYLTSKCRPCQADYHRERLQEDPVLREKKLEITRRWRAEHADDPLYKAVKKEVERRDYAKNGKRRRAAYYSQPQVRAKYNQWSREWKAKNKGRVLSDEQKARYKASVLKHKLKKRQDPNWVADDRARNKAWREANPHKLRIYRSAYTARLKTGGDLDSIRQAFMECLESYRIGDQYWDVYESRLIDKPSIDHIVPLYRGGTNDADNLVVTSKANNSSKREASLLMYLLKRARQYHAG